MFKRLLHRLIRPIVKELLDRPQFYCDVLAYSILYSQIDVLTKEVNKLKPVVAFDVGYREAGFIVIAQRIGDKELCDIIPMHPKASMADYRDMKNRIEAEYGVQGAFVDCAYGDDHTKHLLKM